MCTPRIISADDIPAIILDTDLSSDVDDVGAVAVLHALSKSREAQILAMMVSSGDPWSAGCLDALNTWFGRPDIPLGMIQGKSVVHPSKYTEIIAHEYPHDTKSPAEIPDAVQLYRKVLAGSPDQSVTIVSVGYLTNLRNLLESHADEISPLDGTDLVLQKVKKLVCMGGEYPQGREWNFYQDAAAAVSVIKGWPTQIIFCGFEVGRDVLTGSGLRESEIPNPVRRSYELYNDLNDRPSWDQVAVLYAVRKETNTLMDTWFREENGFNTIQANGSNAWLYSRVSDHSFIYRKVPASILAEEIESLMLSSFAAP